MYGTYVPERMCACVMYYGTSKKDGSTVPQCVCVCMCVYAVHV